MKMLKKSTVWGSLGDIVFGCRTCFAMFVATDKEYKRGLTYTAINHKINSWTGHVTGTKKPTWILTVKCPQCQTELNKYVPTDLFEDVEEDYYVTGIAG